MNEQVKLIIKVWKVWQRKMQHAKYTKYKHTQILSNTHRVSNRGAQKACLRCEQKSEWGSARWEGPRREEAEGESSTCPGSEAEKSGASLKSERKTEVRAAQWVRWEWHVMSSQRQQGLGGHAGEHGGPEKNSGLHSPVFGSLWRQLSDMIRLEFSK